MWSTIFPQFTDGENKAQRGEEPGLSLQSQGAAELRWAVHCPSLSVPSPVRIITPGWAAGDEWE